MKGTMQLAIELDAQGQPPIEFKIFPKGKFKTRKGEFLFDDEAAKAVMADAAEFGAEYPLDYAHAMFKSALIDAGDPAETNKAAGWFRPELRNGELWATSVEWTPKATEKLKSKEFRYTSPTFDLKQVDAGKRITRLLNVALTNVPATHGLKPLMADAVSSEHQETQQMKTIATMLGINADASEADVVARIAQLVDASITKYTGESDVTKAKAMLDAHKASHSKATLIEAELGKVKLEARKKDVARVLDEKIQGGFVLPAQRETYESLGVDQPAVFDKLMEAATMQLVKASGPVDRAKVPPASKGPRGDDIPMLSAAELERQGWKSQEQYRRVYREMLEDGSIEAQEREMGVLLGGAR